MADKTQFQRGNPGLVSGGALGFKSTVDQSYEASAILVSTMERIDPFLRFLTKATGKATVPLAMLQSVLPTSARKESNQTKVTENGSTTKHEKVVVGNESENRVAERYDVELKEVLLELTHRGVLNYNEKKQTIGFPLPPSSSTGSDPSTSTESSISNDENEGSDRKRALIKKIQNPPSKFIGKGLHGSTEPTAKRRMKVLKWTLDQVPFWIEKAPDSSPDDFADMTVEANDSRHVKVCAKRKGKCDKIKFDQSDEIDSSVDANVQDANRIENFGSDRDEVRGDVNILPDSNRREEEDKEAKDNNSSERKAAYRALANLLRGYDDGPLEEQNISNSDNSSRSALSDSDKNTKNEVDDSCDATDRKTERQWLPCQAAYAGSHAGRSVRYGSLTPDTLRTIPSEVLKLFGLDAMDANMQNENGSNYHTTGIRKLFLHQSKAIESAMNGIHTVVCTGTGSGKSLCFLLPVLAKALISLRQSQNCLKLGSAAILLFPTKALAQDQYSKLSLLLKSLQESDDSRTSSPLRAGVIDGDTPHSQRDEIASECQIILTNPDTLHAAILPNWNKKPSYQSLLARLKTIVIDEAHVYEGAFGAHVSMVLARLKRVCRVASSPSNTAVELSDMSQCKITLKSQTAQSIPLFIACSATMIHPEQHFRLLCPIAEDEEVKVLTSEEDGSACAPKHFFVWNPPILDVNGNSTGSVFLPKQPKNTATDSTSSTTMEEIQSTPDLSGEINEDGLVQISIGSRKNSRKRKRKHFSEGDDAVTLFNHNNYFTRRRHSADETAFLLAKAIATGSVRCIAFCKTRMLVEWVYERCLAILKSDPKTSHLTSRVESYRGGYSADARRSIEDRLFKRELWGVVGTNALELGVDVGGIDLTLHCGYPGSLNSLLQQSGRAGRGKGSVTRTGEIVPSCAIMICFSSPSEQYLWRNPTSLLSRGVAAPPTLPVNGSVVKGHILCAGEEFPLVGNRPVSCLLNEYGNSIGPMSTDCELLGGEVYHEEVEYLLQKGLLTRKTVNAVAQVNEKRMAKVNEIVVYSTHPVVKHPWQRVSLRSIEPLNYSIVDLSHPMQGGKTDKIYNQAAIMDSIPYSRVFYHAFPGAVIMHRGRKYRIDSMESPPPFVGGANFGPCSCSNLCAFAKPTTVQYSTQALSLSQITVVKQLEHAELLSSCDKDETTQNEVIKHQLNENGNDRILSHADADGAITPGSVAGSGIVTVKRTVHGYKKLSHVNRKELSRTHIVLPPMEFDTSAIWIDADSSYLRDVVNDFDSGVHALSHAMVAVAPVFVACTSSDLSCDCSRYECTRVLLYDLRAGGSGISAQLYGSLIQCLEAAIELLEECPTCYLDKKYDGGCPGCLQSIPCDNFHQDLSRLAGVRIGKHLLKRLKRSSLAGDPCSDDVIAVVHDPAAHTHSKHSSRRMDGLQNVVKPTNIIIGRASWMENKDRDRWANVDDD